MNKAAELRSLLESIDRKGYPAYKSTKGSYDFGSFYLTIDHVQGDPFAAPSHLTIRVRGSESGFPKEYYGERHRRIALQDFIARRFHQLAAGFDRKASGSGKSGAVVTCSPGQEVLERTAMHIDSASGDIYCRLHVGFPANGRTINSRELIKILFSFLPQCVKNGLYFSSSYANELKEAINLSDDQAFIRQELEKRGLSAFVADNSILPRKSGISPLPMKEAVPFTSPESLKVKMELPHKGVITGMGIKKGVTLIVGGGYHGKSTLLKALELGVYNHIAGDGREYVITDSTAVKIRSEDGRSVHGTDISLFINNLPDGRDTKKFSSEDASGSTSQAANVVEAMESGSKLLLIDEDTCATTFMIRDELMQKVISPDKEPITPFIEKIRPLSESGISTIMVAGSFGAYFRISDTVIQMDNYRAFDITEKALESVEESPRTVHTDSPPRTAPTDSSPDSKYPAIISRFDFRDRIKTRTLGTDGFMINHETVELRYLEQLVCSGQNTALCRILINLMGKSFGKRMSLDEMVDEVVSSIDKYGLDALYKDSPYVPEGLTYVRKQEIIACLNRCRFITMG